MSDKDAIFYLRDIELSPDSYRQYKNIIRRQLIKEGRYNSKEIY